MSGGYLRHQWRDHLRKCTNLPPGAVHMALELHSHMNDRGTCYPGHDLLGENTHLKRTAVVKRLARLREQGWLEIAERGRRTPEGEPNKASIYRALVPDHECKLTASTSNTVSDVPAPSLGENPTPAPALVNQSRVRGDGQLNESRVRGGGSTNHSRVSSQPEPRIDEPEPRFAPTKAAYADPYPLNPPKNPPDEPAAEPPLMSMEEIKADPRIQEPLDQLEKLSDEWKKSRPYVEKLALHIPLIAEALQAALETERRKPGTILGATRWTRKVAHKMAFDQGHQGQREAERQLADGSTSLPVPQFREPEEVVAE